MREPGAQEAGHLFNSVEGSDQSDIDCPMFLKELARPIVSTGKSLQLIQHVPDDVVALFYKDRGSELDFPRLNDSDGQFASKQFQQGTRSNTLKTDICEGSFNCARLMGVLTLPEVFFISLTGLVGDGDHIYQKLTVPFPDTAEMYKLGINKETILKGLPEDGETSLSFEKIWVKFLADAVTGRREIEGRKGDSCHSGIMQVHGSMKAKCNLVYESTKSEDSEMFSRTNISSLHPYNPIMTVSRQFIEKHKASWSNLNISQYIRLPPLNDENLRKAIYSEKFDSADISISNQNGGSLPSFSGTDYTFGYQHNEVKQHRVEDDIRNMEYLYSFPTLLPFFQV